MKNGAMVHGASIPGARRGLSPKERLTVCLSPKETLTATGDYHYNPFGLSGMRGYFLLYDIVSIVLGVSATFVVLILYIKTRNPRLAAYLWVDLFVALIVLAVSFDLYCEIAGQMTSLRPVIWHSVEFSVCALCFFIPRMCRREKSEPWELMVERGFAASAIVLALSFAVFFIFLSSRTWIFIFLYILAYLDLSLVSTYFFLSVLKTRKPAARSSKLRHYQMAVRFTGWATLVLLPFFLITDFFGWLLPFFSTVIPPGFTLLPAFYIFMSLGILFGSALEILEPGAALEPMTADDDCIRTYGLTKREAEIAPLVLQCFSYKEIGARLFISPGTVRSHLTHIYEKTRTKNRLELSGLIQADRRNKADRRSQAE